MSLANIIQVLASGIHDIQSIRYAQLASGTIIIFDHLITLDAEVELIWKSAWSWGKVFFLLNRYHGLLSVIINNYGIFSPSLTDSFCLSFFRWQGWTGLIAGMIAEVILQMRLFALYSLNKRILALMAGCFLITSGTAAAVMGTVLSKISATAIQVTPNIRFCVPAHVSHQFYTFWIPLLAFETLLCTLAIVKGYQTFRSSSPPFRSGRHLVAILIRDSLLYFLVMFATYLTNLLIWMLASQNIIEIPVGFAVAMSCVLGNRIILNVRSVNKEERATRASEKPLSHAHNRLRSVVLVQSSEKSLSEIEMGQLRSMRAGM